MDYQRKPARCRCTVSWTLDAAGNRTSLIWPETGALAYQTTNVYDQLNRLTDIYEGAGTTGQRLAHYTYDKLSQRSTAAFGGTSAVPAASVAYSYTSAGQVSQISDSWNGSSLSLAYSYNADHQRTSETASLGRFLQPDPIGTQGSLRHHRRRDRGSEPDPLADGL